MPEEESRKKVVELGGTPKEFFEHPELLEVLLPILKNDFKITETYEHNGKVNPFDYNITVLVEKDEEVNAEQMFGWKDHTKNI